MLHSQTLDKHLLLSKCVLMQMVVHGKAPQYLKDLMIPSERLHVHGNKQLLPRTRTDMFNTSFSFSGSLPHHLRYPMELKTFKRKAFQALTKPHWYLFFHSPDNLDTKCTVPLLPPPLACSCQVLHLYLKRKSTFNLCIFMHYCTHFHFPCGHYSNALYIYIWVHVPPFNFQFC